MMMKNGISLMALALLTWAFGGCSPHSPAAGVPKTTDWGVIEVTNGISSRHILADGRACTVTPTILAGGHQLELITSLTDTNAAGVRRVYSLTSYLSPDKVTIFSFDPSNAITLTLHISK